MPKPTQPVIFLFCDLDHTFANPTGTHGYEVIGGLELWKKTFADLKAYGKERGITFCVAPVTHKARKDAMVIQFLEEFKEYFYLYDTDTQSFKSGYTLYESHYVFGKKKDGEKKTRTLFIRPEVGHSLDMSNDFHDTWCPTACISNDIDKADFITTVVDAIGLEPTQCLLFDNRPDIVQGALSRGIPALCAPFLASPCDSYEEFCAGEMMPIDRDEKPGAAEKVLTQLSETVKLMMRQFSDNKSTLEVANISIMRACTTQFDNLLKTHANSRLKSLDTIPEFDPEAETIAGIVRFETPEQRDQYKPELSMFNEVKSLEETPPLPTAELPPLSYS